jgi:hypothetical protein
VRKRADALVLGQIQRHQHCSWRRSPRWFNQYKTASVDFSHCTLLPGTSSCASRRRCHCYSCQNRYFARAGFLHFHAYCFKSYARATVIVGNRQKSCRYIAKSGPMTGTRCICEERLSEQRGRRRNTKPGSSSMLNRLRNFGVSLRNFGVLYAYNTPVVCFRFVIALIYRSFRFHARLNWSWHGFCE